MKSLRQHAPVLIFTYGNPSRGDDALGPAMFDLLERHKEKSSELNDVDLLTDFQLQIEHAIDLDQRQGILFIDASVSCSSPFTFQKLQAEQDDSYTTHAMSPASVLSVYRKINQQEPPPCYMLSIRGYEFGLGHDMSLQAQENLQRAYEFIQKIVAKDVEDWDRETF
jgi:hydrogenase maturation protease